jgi:rhodanese-related sulfurtransferase
MRDFQPDPLWMSRWTYGNRASFDRVDQWEVTPLTLKRLLEQGDENLIVVDVREPWEAEICRIEGSRLIPLGELEYRAEDELDREQEIVVYCHHGIQGIEAAATLWGLGYERVQNLAGGISRWADLVEPDMDRY